MFLDELLIDPGKEGQFKERLGLHSFAFQVLVEPYHVVAVHSEEVERLQQANVPWMRTGEHGRALQAQVAKTLLSQYNRERPLILVQRSPIYK